MVAYNTTPSGRNGGIWMSGAAPAVDDEGFIYLLTGNGDADLGPEGGPNRGHSFLKLRRRGRHLADGRLVHPLQLRVLEAEDRDLGSSGVLLVPGTNIVLGGSKEGKLYLVDRTNMGKHRATDDDQILQTVALTGAARAHNHGRRLLEEPGGRVPVRHGRAGLPQAVPHRRRQTARTRCCATTRPQPQPFGLPMLTEGEAALALYQLPQRARHRLRRSRRSAPLTAKRTLIGEVFLPGGAPGAPTSSTSTRCSHSSCCTRPGTRRRCARRSRRPRASPARRGRCPTTTSAGWRRASASPTPARPRCCCSRCPARRSSTRATRSARGRGPPGERFDRAGRDRHRHPMQWDGSPTAASPPGSPGCRWPTRRGATSPTSATTRRRCCRSCAS